jgi:uridine kinase
MASWTPQKRDVLDALADEFLHNYGKGRTLLAVDGVDGAEQFADALAERMGRGGHSVFRASMDRFQKPRAMRLARGADSAETYYRDTFDYELFRRVLVQPFKLGGSTGFVTAAFDAERDAQIEMDWKTGPQDATLIVDGAFLNRPELRGLWNFSVWLEVAAAGEQPLYAAEAKPREQATAIMDISDPEHPRRLFADSC